eukprot:1307700-Amorphochlora_amoeboformis.AAC.1
MYLIIQGEEFSSSEISKVFFSVTKLFNSRDVYNPLPLFSPPKSPKTSQRHDIHGLVVMICGFYIVGSPSPDGVPFS